MLSNPKDREALLNGIKEMSNSMTRVDAEKDFQKDVIDKLNDELDLDKKYIRKLAAIYHKQNYTTVQQEYDEVQALYEAITSSNP
jgi:predicted translin family RNA/ssDNA-binding protein